MTLPGGSMEDFVDLLGSPEATPGGGSAGAMAGAMGAALVRLIAELTTRRMGPEAEQAEVRGIQTRARDLQVQLLAAVDRDAEVLAALLEALRLPRANPADQADRQQRIDEAARRAARVPLETGDACVQVLTLAYRLVDRCSPLTVSDVGAAAALAAAGLRGNLMNLRTNVNFVRDAAVRQEISTHASDLIAQGEGLRVIVFERVAARVQDV